MIIPEALQVQSPISVWRIALRTEQPRAWIKSLCPPQPLALGPRLLLCGMGREGERARHGAVGSPVSTLAIGLPPASSGGCVGFWGSRPRIQLDSAPNTPNHRHEPPPPGRSRPGLSCPQDPLASGFGTA